MPIRSMSADGTLTKRCASCDMESTVAPGAAELGYVSNYNPADTGSAAQMRKYPNMIVLPPCPGCGAVETLQMNHDVCPPEYVGSPFDIQRRAVNRYARKLAALGHVQADCSAEVTALGDPPDLMAEADMAVNLPMKSLKFGFIAGGE